MSVSGKMLGGGRVQVQLELAPYIRRCKAFCPTGQGGGVDNSCGRGGGSAGDFSKMTGRELRGHLEGMARELGEKQAPLKARIKELDATIDGITNQWRSELDKWKEGLPEDQRFKWPLPDVNGNGEPQPTVYSKRDGYKEALVERESANRESDSLKKEFDERVKKMLQLPEAERVSINVHGNLDKSQMKKVGEWNNEVSQYISKEAFTRPGWATGERQSVGVVIEGS